MSSPSSNRRVKPASPSADVHPTRLEVPDQVQRLFPTRTGPRWKESFAASTLWGQPRGEEALAALASLPLPCVVVVDQRLPGITGTEVAAQLLASSQADQLHVIFTSGSTLVAPLGAGLLRKPFEARALLALIRDAFARSDRD